MEIIPAQVHMHLDILLRAGKLLIITVGGPPGIQGAGMTGIQGTGVGTPRAAAVAAINIGFDGDMHIPNGGMLTIGIMSMMVAAGGPLAITGGPLGTTTNVLGARPNMHLSIAPDMTCWLISYSSLAGFPRAFLPAF
ncbi:MAG: hypothetical protein ACI87W_002399 [Halieaceae bacterium]|jgi:hypothetical protein